MRFGYHAEALDAHGRDVPERLVSDWTIYADFNVDGDNHDAALQQARDWAARIMAADPRVAAVSIRQSVQENPGGYWRAGRGAELIERNQPAEQAPAADPSLSRAGHTGLDASNGELAAGPVPAQPLVTGQAFPRLRPGSAPAIADGGAASRLAAQHVRSTGVHPTR